MKKKVETKTAGDISAEENTILEWINSIKFKKRLFGGIDESDVWKKIDELNTLYEKLLIAERSKCITLSQTQATVEGEVYEQLD